MFIPNNFNTSKYYQFIRDSRILSIFTQICIHLFRIENLSRYSYFLSLVILLNRLKITIFIFLKKSENYFYQKKITYKYLDRFTKNSYSNLWDKPFLGNGGN